MLVVANGRRFDPVVLEKLVRLSRILARYPNHFLEDADRPIRYVFQVADGGCHYVQRRRAVVVHDVNIISRDTL